MTRTVAFTLSLAASVLITSTFLVASASPSAGPATAAVRQAGPEATPGDPIDDQGAPLFVRICGDCHDSQRIVSHRRTKAEWEDIIKKMIGEGAEGTEKEFLAVFAYLRHHYGKVFINAAVAEEITLSLGLTDKDAAAILAYRKTNGSFADLDALKKVPDIDVKALDAHKDALAF